MARCRSCGARITWARTAAGKAIPLEPAPEGTDGNIALTDSGTAAMVGPGKGDWVAHFVTCPEAAKHRRPK